MFEALTTASYPQILIITIATVFLIIISRKLEKSIFPAILVIANLVLLVYHGYILAHLPRN